MLQSFRNAMNMRKYRANLFLSAAYRQIAISKSQIGFDYSRFLF